MTAPTLHLMCGKIASGKSTLAKTLATEYSAILLSEDYWLSRLYPDDITSVADYVRFAHRIRDVVGPLVVSLLQSGVTVVLDFPANTHADRQWLRTLAEESGTAHCLHFLDVEDDICLARLHARNHNAEHDFSATDAEFRLITGYFRSPDAAEGLNILVHNA
ncbi:cell division protein ZipA [Pseudomonas syringae]|uniref:Cell division protein ZipA n=1 Tax=Pseudomonas syringae TaxID=317 RepID=A0A244ER23_PSESX|nr:ATP-binding protein [Pseudomonas syringae]OUM06965.1 cell division protein ZipA [Pseudomonas syringae]